VSKDLSEPLRSHKDLDKDAAPFYKKAEKFYDALANQLVNQGHVLDLFASALDQVFTFPECYLHVKEKIWCKIFPLINFLAVCSNFTQSLGILLNSTLTWIIIMLSVI
jgi:hypothetical protein